MAAEREFYSDQTLYYNVVKTVKGHMYYIFVNACFVKGTNYTLASQINKSGFFRGFEGGHFAPPPRKMVLSSLSFSQFLAI